MKKILKLSLVALAAAALIGCAHTKSNSATDGANVGDGSSTSGLTQDQTLQQTLTSMPNKVYFAFNKYNLDSDAVSVLQQNAAVLLKNPQVSVMLAGNADPRGSEEYNFHLGMKRAKAVYDYFMQQGIPASQMCMVSYGELQLATTPADQGGDAEKAYALDRRTEVNFNQTCSGQGSGS